MTEIADRPLATTVTGRTVPHLVTEIPGPKAREHIAFDQAWSRRRALLAGIRACATRVDSAAVEDIDGKPFRLNGGHAVSSTGHWQIPRVSASAIHKKLRSMTWAAL